MAGLEILASDSTVVVSSIPFDNMIAGRTRDATFDLWWDRDGVIGEISSFIYLSAAQYTDTSGLDNGILDNDYFSIQVDDETSWTALSAGQRKAVGVMDTSSSVQIRLRLALPADFTTYKRCFFTLNQACSVPVQNFGLFTDSVTRSRYGKGRYGHAKGAGFSPDNNRVRHKTHLSALIRVTVLDGDIWSPFFTFPADSTTS